MQCDPAVLTPVARAVRTGAFDRSRSRIFDVLLALAVAALGAAAYLSHYGAAAALNSDSVMPYVLYDDLVLRGARFAAWVYPEAPFWLPDQLLVWCIYSLLHQLLPAVYAYALLQAAAYLLAGRWVLSLLDPRNGRQIWWTWLALWLLGSLAGATIDNGWFQYFHSNLFLPNNHGGTSVAVVLGLALLLRAQRAQDCLSLGWIGVLCATMLLSDRLFAVQFVAPALLLVLLPGNPLGPRLRLQLAGLLGAVLALSEVLRRLAGANFLGIRGTDGSTVWRGRGGFMPMLHDLGTLLITDPATGVCELLALASLAALGWQSWRRRATALSDAPLQRRALFVLFAIAAVLLPPLAAAVLGRHGALRDFRYEQTLGLSGLALALVLAPLLRVRLHRYRVVVATMALLLLGGSVANVDISMARLRDHDAAQLACIRGAQLRYDLHFGYAQYWNAMSRMAQIPDLVVAPLLANLQPHAYLNVDLDWFASTGTTAGNSYVEEGGLDPGLLDASFGIPLARLACPDSALRIYPPGRGMLTQLYRLAPWLADRRLLLSGQGGVPGAAWAKDAAMTRGDAIVLSPSAPVSGTILAGVAYRTASTLSDWLGYGIFAPGMFLYGAPFERDAVHRIWFDYRLEPVPAGAALRVHVDALDAVGTRLREMDSRELPGHAQTVRLSVDLAPPPPGTAAFAVRLEASGMLDGAIYSIGWGRQ